MSQNLNSLNWGCIGKYTRDDLGEYCRGYEAGMLGI